jgi:hypothetical protein
MKHLKILRENLIVIILLLVGLSFLHPTVVFILPFILPVDNVDLYRTLIFNSHWISDTMFGIVIFWLTRGKGVVAIPIGLLSTVLPLYGTIFYLLTTLPTKSEHD